MYISEAIRQADALAPNEYTLNEKYAWCDELGAMLYQEYLKRYKKAVLEPDESGEYLLPEGITFEMVDKIIAQGREIEKYDFRSFGIRPIYGFRHKCYIPEHCQRQGDIAVIYLEQYQPIRTASVEKVRHCVDSNGTRLMFPLDDMPLQVGDAVKITGSNGSMYIGTYDEATGIRTAVCSITDIEVSPTGWTNYCAAQLSEQSPQGSAGLLSYVSVERIVTEETIVPPPYDQMYIDWIIAKIAFYQNNFIVYNQQMNKFNQTIGAYHNWLMERRTQNKNDRVTGWW